MDDHLFSHTSSLVRSLKPVRSPITFITTLINWNCFRCQFDAPSLCNKKSFFSHICLLNIPVWKNRSQGKQLNAYWSGHVAAMAHGIVDTWPGNCQCASLHYKYAGNIRRKANALWNGLIEESDKHSYILFTQCIKNPSGEGNPAFAPGRQPSENLRIPFKIKFLIMNEYILWESSWFSIGND